MLAGVKYVGVSRKIESDDERDRLYKIGLSLTDDGPDGLIVRTAAKGLDAERLQAEYAILKAQLEDMKRNAGYTAAPGLIYDDNDLALRAVRDMLTEDVEGIWTDDERCFDRLLTLAKAMTPDLAGRVQRHGGDTPLFDLYRVDSQIDRALERYVWLDSGGSLVIDETEAMTVVDVNTGKNTGKRDADETILAVNREAARELMRQLRLRDIGGTVIVDFINMRRAGDAQALMSTLRECAASDRNRTRVVDITALGLVELTRKRVRQSLSKQLTHTCSDCGGNGAVPSHEATGRRALRDLWRPLQLEAAPAVCGWIKRIGMPEGSAVQLSPIEGMGAGEYCFTPMESKL